MITSAITRALRPLALVAAASCGTDTPRPDVSAGPRVDYVRDIQPIWDRWCTSCHNFHTPHLVAAESFEALRGASWRPCLGGTERAPFVVPGDPDASFLVYKLTGEDPGLFSEASSCARLMPPPVSGSPSPLVHADPDAVATVRRWIAQGAQRE